MNLPKSEALNSGTVRLLGAMQNWQIRVRSWLKAEFEDAQFYYIRFRAENGDALNQFRFALMYETGHRGLRSDYEAHKWFLRAAFQGMPDAQAKVSAYQLLGCGIPRNEEEAFKWCRKAAEQGHAVSQSQLARMYNDGIGVERNPTEAKKWQARAASQRIPIPQAVHGQLSTC
jgi:TPR repeat protein